MDLEALRNGIRANVAAAIPTLNCLAYAEDDATPDVFFVARVLPTFDEAMNRGLDRVVVTARILVEGTDVDSQKRLDSYLKGSGSTSLKAAIQSDKTAGGACHSLRVVAFDSQDRYSLGSSAYPGAELTIDVIGGN